MKRIIYFLLFILLISFVTSADAGLSIKYPIMNHLKINKEIYFHFHIFNVSNGYGYRTGDSINCTFHLYNNTGNHIYIAWNDTFTNLFDIEFKYTFTRVADYSYIVYCETIPPEQSKILGGKESVGFMVTESGEYHSDENMIPIAALILLPLLFAFILMIGAATLGEEHGALKIGMLLITPVLFWASSYIGIVSVIRFYGFPEMHTAIARVVFWVGMFFFFLVCYFLMYLFHKGIKTAAKAKAEKLEY